MPQTMSTRIREDNPKMETQGWSLYAPTDKKLSEWLFHLVIRKLTPVDYQPFKRKENYIHFNL